MTNTPATETIDSADLFRVGHILVDLFGLKDTTMCDVRDFGFTPNSENDCASIALETFDRNADGSIAGVTKHVRRIDYKTSYADWKAEYLE